MRCHLVLLPYSPLPFPLKHQIWACFACNKTIKSLYPTANIKIWPSHVIFLEILPTTTTNPASVETFPHQPIACQPRKIAATSPSPTMPKCAAQRQRLLVRFCRPATRPGSRCGFRPAGDLPPRCSNSAISKRPQHSDLVHREKKHNEPRCRSFSAG